MASGKDSSSSGSGPSNSGGDGGGDNFGLPFAPQPNALFTPARRSLSETLLSDDEKARIWDALYVAYGARNDVQKARVTSFVIQYFIENGASQRCDFTVEALVGGVTFHAGVIKNVLLEFAVLPRRFARSNARLAQAFLRANPGLAASQASKMGLPVTYADLAFDFSDALPLTPTERTALQNAREFSTRSSAALPTISGNVYNSGRRSSVQENRGAPSDFF
jgi:phage tail protein X